MSDETTIARLRADLAASQAHAKRVAKEVGDVTERRDCLWEMFKTATAEYRELRAAIDLPADDPGASTHAGAVIHGEWLTSIAKEQAKRQRVEALADRLKRDGVEFPNARALFGAQGPRIPPARVRDDGHELCRFGPIVDSFETDGDVIPSTAPADLVRRAGTFERDDAIRLTLERTARTSSMRIDPRMPCHWQECTDTITGSSSNPSDPSYTPWRGFVHWAFMAGRESMVRTLDENASAPVRVLDGDDGSERDDPDGDEGISIDRTAAGCATAAHPLRCGDEYCELHGCARPGDCRSDEYHGGTSELAADDVLDDPRMGGEEWIDHSDVTVAMGDAWPLWERRYYKGSHSIDHWVKLCGRLPVGTYRPLRFPHQNAETGAIGSRYMTPEHFARVVDWEWGLVGCGWDRQHCGFSDVKHGDPCEQWRPVGWPDVEAKPEELEANIDKSLLMPPGAGATAAAEFDAAIEKYSPDMRDLAGRIAAVERRQSSLDTLVPLVTQLGERLNKLEGVEPEETPDPLLDGLVPVRADAIVYVEPEE